MSIAVIAGLGNPGQNYRDTRHNIGFLLVDSFAESLGVAWKTESLFRAEAASVDLDNHRVLLLKPNTFMNESGRSLSAVLRYKKLPTESLLVIYDDINLELGQSKLSAQGSAGGHNGIANILSHIGSDFLRYRIGIGAKPHQQMDLADYVLGKFSLNEQKILANKMPTYLKHLQLIIDKGPVLAMNSINQRIALSHECTNKKQL